MRYCQLAQSMVALESTSSTPGVVGCCLMCDGTLSAMSFSSQQEIMHIVPTQ